MRKHRSLMVGFILVMSSPAFAAAEQCGSIGTSKERLACVARAASAHEANKPPIKEAKEVAGSHIDPVDALKIENDRVSARLNGICRGC